MDRSRPGPPTTSSASQPAVDAQGRPARPGLPGWRVARAALSLLWLNAALSFSTLASRVSMLSAPFASTPLAFAPRCSSTPFFAVTPGIRPAMGPRDDQQRVTTVTHAVQFGAGLLVLGRAVTAAPDPRAALAEARAEAQGAAAGQP